MVAMPAIEQPLPGGDDLLQRFLALDTPPGYKAELIEGEIVVTPPPNGSHEDAISVIASQFYRKAETDLAIAPTKGLITPSGHVIPDGTVTPIGHFREAESWADTAGVLLVYEITSSNPLRDRVQKRHGYAAANIPFYLLVDRSEGRATLFSHPTNGDYTAENSVKFGDPLDLPAPFSFTLDTERLG